MTKDELKQYLSLKREAETLEAGIKQLEEEAASVRAIVIDGMPKSNFKGDPVGNVVAKLNDLKEKYIDKCNAALEAMNRIEQVIEKLDNPTERDLMRKKYIEGKHWEDIAEELHYHERHIYRIHNRALKRVTAVSLNVS